MCIIVECPNFLLTDLASSSFVMGSVLMDLAYVTLLTKVMWSEQQHDNLKICKGVQPEQPCSNFPYLIVAVILKLVLKP